MGLGFKGRPSLFERLARLFLKRSGQQATLPRAAQIILHHLRRQAERQAARERAARADASRESFLSDLLAGDENAGRQPGE